MARWTVLFIVATAMMMGYFVNDVMLGTAAALGALLTAIVMLHIDKKKGYGLQLPNIK